MAGDGAGHDAEPLLRLRAAGDHGRRHGCGERGPGPRGRGRRRVDVALGPHRRFGHHRRRATPTSGPRSRPCPQGISADLIATLEGFDRADVDAFAVESQRRAEVALNEGRFERGVIAVTDATGDVLLARDEHPRAGHVARRPGEVAAPRSPEMGATYDDVARERYPQVDHIDHVHHAGNSSRCRRRRRRGGRGVGRLGQRARGHAARRDPRHRRDRLGAGDHVDRARPRRRAVPRQGGDEDRRHRPLGGQRGVRRRPAQDDPRPRSRSRAR